MTDYLHVSDEAMRAWLPTCENLARQFVGRFNAEFDDLVQEGWEFCFRSLRQGIPPHRPHIRHRMLNWCRYLDKLDRGDTAGFTELDYDEEDMEIVYEG